MDRFYRFLLFHLITNLMILILTQCFPSRLGGIESLVSNLSLALSKKEVDDRTSRINEIYGRL